MKFHNKIWETLYNIVTLIKISKCIN